VGFDLDDTLMDHSVAVGRGLVSMIEASGWPQLPDDLVLWRELERRHYPRYVLGELSFRAQRRERLSAFLMARDIDPAATDLDGTFAEYFSHYERHWAVVPGARELLESQRSVGRAIGILTNGPRDLQIAKLERIGLDPYVDHLIAVDDLRVGKPDPSAFAELCARLGASPVETLYVGDDLEADARGARGAGLQTVWFRRPYAVGVLDETDDEIPVVDDLMQVAALLDSAGG
jgi:putative hydrolase of the HAD superfamily